MEFTTYVRKPFTVKAVPITKENIAEVAKLVGDLEEDENGSPSILVDPRKVPNITRVYPGFYMTKMGRQVRCYSRRVFTDQFMEHDEKIQPWLDFINGEKKADV